MSTICLVINALRKELSLYSRSPENPVAYTSSLRGRSKSICMPRGPHKSLCVRSRSTSLPPSLLGWKRRRQAPFFAHFPFTCSHSSFSPSLGRCMHSSSFSSSHRHRFSTSSSVLSPGPFYCGCPRRRNYFSSSLSSTWGPPSGVSSTSRCKHWMSLLIYGTAHAPLLGTCWPPLLSVKPLDLTELREEPRMLPPPLSPHSTISCRTRELYCKAVVSASGGHRLARDYIAGLTAAVEGDENLVALCLQHPVGEQDVDRFCQHLLDTWCEEQEKADQIEEKKGEEEEPEGKEREGIPTSSSSLSPVEERNEEISSERSSSEALIRSAHEEEEEEEELVTEEGMRMAQLFVFAFSPIIRCFLYDVMCAATYQRTRHTLLMEKIEKKLIHLGVHVLGVPRERVMALWKVVLAEAHLKKETYNLLVPLIE